MLLDHVCVMVSDVRKTARSFNSLGFKIEPESEFKGEGTREIYVEKNKTASLLLVQAIAPGPYQRAYEKRGPCLHHLCLHVKDLTHFIKSVEASGWFLHLKSFEMIRKSKTLYLCRPGVPMLIEVHERELTKSSEPFMTQIEIKMDVVYLKLFEFLNLQFEIYLRFEICILVFPFNNG